MRHRLKDANLTVSVQKQKHPVGLLSSVEAYLKRSNLENEAFPSWKQFVFCCYSSKVCILNGDCEEGYEWLAKAAAHWLTICEGQNSAWLIPAMKTMALNLVDLAFLADKQAEVTDSHLSSHKHVTNMESSQAAVAIEVIVLRSERDLGECIRVHLP